MDADEVAELDNLRETLRDPGTGYVGADEGVSRIGCKSGEGRARGVPGGGENIEEVEDSLREWG